MVVPLLYAFIFVEVFSVEGLLLGSQSSLLFKGGKAGRTNNNNIQKHNRYLNVV
jgi:hypothetical protein